MGTRERSGPIRHSLANAIPVLRVDLPDSPLICIDFWCRAGSAAETTEESGIAHFLEHMVFKGSRMLAPGEFDRRIEALGGSSNAATGFDDVHFHVLIPPQGAPEALRLLLDLVLEPRLDAREFQMERQVVLEELAQSEDQPEELALQHLLAQACPNHPYGQPILGQRQQLLSHDPARMASFHDRTYGAGGCCLVLSGALSDGALSDIDWITPLEHSRLAQLPPLPTIKVAPALNLSTGEERLRLPRLESARLLMAWQLPPAADLEAVAGADLLTTLLAEGRRSRLVARLREELRLVESIDLDLHVLEGGSLALLEAVCEEEQLPACRQAIDRVWQELMETPPSEVEWGRAQRLVGNGHRFSLEAAGSVAGLVGSQALWERPLDLQAPLKLLERWTPARLQRELLPLLAPSRSFCLEAVPA
ncbi:MAG: M16 family metallopeptidase [Cyanobacteriota bacterium]